MPTEKRARQKAARQKKRAAEQRKVKARKLLRNGAFIGGGAVVVIVLVLLTTGVFTNGGSSKPGSGTHTTSSSTTTSSPASTASSTTTTTASSTTAPPATGNKALQAAATLAAVHAGCPANPTTRVNSLSWSSYPAMTINPKKAYSATVKTTAGTFVIALDASKAPKTVNSFAFLAGKGFFHCVIFHRVIPGFMDQTGDPTGTGTGGPGYQFANENLPSAYQTGDVAMANSGPNTNGSQFFIITPGGAPKLSPTYSLFGKVTSGMSVVDKINAEGNSSPSANGVPPDVIQRILSVTVQEA